MIPSYLALFVYALQILHSPKCLSFLWELNHLISLFLQLLLITSGVLVVMEGNLAGRWYHSGVSERLKASRSQVTYSLIYAFLRKQAHTKAADAVKKAARNIIVLKDDLQLEGPHLDEIVKQWKELQAAGSS